MAVLGAIGMGVRMSVLLVFVFVLAIRVVVRMLVLRPIGVSVRMGVFVALHESRVHLLPSMVPPHKV
jgi:hypothetical protein